MSILHFSTKPIVIAFICLSLLPTLASSKASANDETDAIYGAPQESKDPWEPFNRAIFKFNEKIVDRYILKPLARTYKTITPLLVRKGVQNFFSNLEEVITIPNDLLQWKLKQAGSDTGRLLVNSSLGIFGLFDFASELGLEKHSEDFGQTFGYWGVPSGPYVVLPFLGPSTLRDAAALIPENAIEPTRQLSDENVGLALSAVEIIALRAEFLESEGIIKGDKYIFIREAYRQQREYLINDGATDDDPFLDDEEW